MADVNVDEINKCAEMEDIVVAYVEDDSEIPVSALQYLRDMTISNHFRLYFVGHNDDIDTIVKNHSFSDVAGRFCRPINANDVADKLIAAIDADPMLERKHILVVDDSGTMLTTIQEWLSNDYRVSIVNSAMNATTFLNKNIPDLILLDYEMPGCSGPQLLEMIRTDSHTEKIPVIFIVEQIHIFFGKLRDHLV